MMNNRDITDIMCIATVTCILGDACVLLLNMILCWHIYSRIASPWYWLWLTDLHWVRALTVPMHLGLIDGPFVPHNLISTQQSPVPLLKFQMVPRLKILMSSGSKKRTQICFSFLSKVLANEPPPGSPSGPLWDDWYYTKRLHSFTAPMESYLKGQDFQSVLPFKIALHFVSVCRASVIIIYSTAFSLQYSLCALYFSGDIITVHGLIQNFPDWCRHL